MTRAQRAEPARLGAGPPKTGRIRTVAEQDAPPGRQHRRIALVTHGLASGGGIPTVTRWLRDALMVEGYTVDVHDLATSSTDSSSRRLLAPTTWLRRSLLGAPDGGAGPLHWGANAVELELMRYRPRRELTRALRQYDLVQVVAGAPAWAAPVVGLGVPVVLHVATLVAWERDTPRADGSRLLGRWRSAMTSGVSQLEQRVLQQVDSVLAENRTLAAFIRSAGQTRVAFAPPGVDTATISPRATGWNRRGHLLSVCRLAEPRKGLDRMVQAYAHLLREYPEAPDLVLAGSGELPSRITSLIATLGIADRIIVRSNVDPTDLVDLYRDASVFLTTSYEEGLGMSVLEAMSCGLPVVSTETAGTSESVVDGRTGFLVPLAPADRVVATVAARVRDLLVGDGGEFGRRGRERCVELFSTQVALRKVIATYDELLPS